jgi:hypothetical protein
MTEPVSNQNKALLFTETAGQRNVYAPHRKRRSSLNFEQARAFLSLSHGPHSVSLLPSG